MDLWLACQVYTNYSLCEKALLIPLSTNSTNSEQTFPLCKRAGPPSEAILWKIVLCLEILGRKSTGISRTGRTGLRRAAGSISTCGPDVQVSKRIAHNAGQSQPDAEVRRAGGAVLRGGSSSSLKRGVQCSGSQPAIGTRSILCLNIVFARTTHLLLAAGPDLCLHESFTRMASQFIGRAPLSFQSLAINVPESVQERIDNSRCSCFRGRSLPCQVVL